MKTTRALVLAAFIAAQAVLVPIPASAQDFPPLEQAIEFVDGLVKTQGAHRTDISGAEKVAAFRAAIAPHTDELPEFGYVIVVVGERGALILLVNGTAIVGMVQGPATAVRDIVSTVVGSPA